MRFTYIRNSLLIAAIAAIALAYPIYAWCTAEVSRAIIASGLIAFGNTLIGGITLDYAFDKPNNIFMFAVFGGMGVRMALILILLTILLLNGYHALSLALSLMGFYVLFMIYEIIYVTRQLSHRSRKARREKAVADRRTSLRTLSVEFWSN